MLRSLVLGSQNNFPKQMYIIFKERKTKKNSTCIPKMCPIYCLFSASCSKDGFSTNGLPYRVKKVCAAQLPHVSHDRPYPLMCRTTAPLPASSPKILTVKVPAVPNQHQIRQPQSSPRPSPSNRGLLGIIAIRTGTSHVESVARYRGFWMLVQPLCVRDHL
jgi:hypothetical protein